MTRFLVALTLILAAGPALAQDRPVVSVNGTTIRQSEVFERLWKRYGPETLEEMVDEMLLRQAAQKANVKVSDAEVENRVAKLRDQFADAKLFESELANAGSSLEKLRADLKDQLQRERLVITDKKLSVGDAELKKAFDEHKDDLGTKEGVHLKHILVEKQADADKVVADVKAGGDFGAIARERSIAPTGKINGGDYGMVSKGMLPPDIEAIAFAMKPNELRIVPSQRGFHVLQALERRPAAAAEFAKVKDDLRDVMMQEKVKAVLPDYLRSLRAKADIKPVQ